MRFARILGLLLAISVTAGSASASWARPSCSSSEYDLPILAAVAKWWPEMVPLDASVWWKAQLCQESRLDPTAVSPAGAKGIAQFMPGTWSDAAPRSGHADASAFDADAAIDAGAWYMGTLRRFWRAAMDPDRQSLAQGSYNAGPGNIGKAVKLCGGDLRWDTIVKCLPAITGAHARETIDYVARIAEWRRQILSYPH